jgi:DNA polymerase III subunit chi
MTPASIYFVETDVKDQRIDLCRWVERFYEEGKKVQVLTDSTLAAQHLDQLLWTFSQGSFIPHRTVAAKTAGPFKEPVIITIGEIWLENFDVLICDGASDLEFMKNYPLLVHFILLDDPERKQTSRLMWQKARDLGFRLHHLPRSQGPGR